MKTLILLSLLIACTEQYSINSTCKELPVGLYYSVHYQQDSTWAYFYDKSVFVGIGIYGRTGDVSREYKEFRTEWNNEILKLRINNNLWEMRR